MLSPKMTEFLDQAPADWKITPRGMLPCVRMLERRELVEVRSTENRRPGRASWESYEWRRLPSHERKVS